ncbi:transcriptional coactivator p15 (PC4) [Gregarina niphandrodes]|uniref:Transcriptional coactivator p15 (PC4) n=1 Tax=Gregarina niphandrodes TaxID=110365 RepID=A0A023BA08_GRENI|nr:transcriptional coactivator p15 (PC4) [Gregarina niphandrodes]EZG76508.1 transcriptional coactivator p15 (PC4) [Gregarina niphandrodes]|eukprot:XP_011129568.1 transcriptional coactivator p15 (PC4) [Gregarina niphandrodes]
MASHKDPTKVKKSSSKKSKKTPTTQETPAAATPAPDEPQTKIETDGGSFDETEGVWSWSLNEDTKLTVKKFNGKPYVDLRKYWDGKPTKKGVSLPLPLFEKIRNWSMFDEALKSVGVNKSS